MDLEALRFANFGKLGTAIDDWSAMITKLEELKEDARTQLDQRSRNANWRGVNATVTREFITKTTGEFGDAVTEATSIRNILRDTRNELIGYQSDLNGAIERGLAKNLTVVSTGGGGFTVSMNIHPDRAAAGHQVPEHTEADVTALRDEVQGILDRATESDSSAAAVLVALVEQSPHGFADASYSDRDTAADALRAADDMARLARNPKDLSPEEFDRLNRNLERYADDDLFAERFATQLGARGTLEFWAGLNDLTENPELSRSRIEQFGSLQEHLGLTLAHATQSDSGAMARWEQDMVGLGDERIQRRASQNYGFQVMSNLMRWGDFDDKFLTNYGNELIANEKQRSHNGRAADIAWHSPMSSMLNRTGSDGGHDPMTGFMRALSNSPQAATDFFSGTFVTADEDHDFKYEDGEHEGERRSLTNFEYLFEERDWLPERNSDGDESVTGQNNLGLALEAATTGHPAGTAPTIDNIPHSREQADLYESIVQSVSENPERLTERGYLSDSFGKITAEYMPDINRALNADVANRANLFPVSGEVAEFGQRDVTRFLHTVGRNPEGYAAVNLGQHNYTTALLEHHFRNPGAYVTDPNFSDMDNLKSAIGAISRNAGEIEGTIGAGRTYELEVEGVEKDAEFNAALDNASTWAGSIAGVGVGMATAPFTGPGGVVAGGLAGTAVDEVLGMIFEGQKKDSSDEVIYRNGEHWDSMQESTSVLVQEGARRAGEAAGNRSPHIESFAGGETEIGFDNAATNVRNYVDGQGVSSEGG
ncbi:hypothetical protein KQY30_22820 [Streptomyces sp. GMY02]|uniref:DUF6571 family protein n=1 Tax=Streptomyces sp. GMY02 TaxID=1333528 RepID=UPI001C2C3B49|nr:DUF6571 family protein [Streptomyces sp. GMY02]QXE36631.1 hypothetical protein KQY30_22820 [Streptomyces sp. GMY02]